MTLSLEPYHIFMIGATFIGAFFGLGKALLKQMVQNLDTRLGVLNGIKDDVHNTAEHVNRLERDFLKMKADMPIHYVRREDFAKQEAQIDSLSKKIDHLVEAINAKIDRVAESLGSKLDKLRENK